MMMLAELLLDLSEKEPSKMAETDDGLKLLARHLARVKLDAAEQKHASESIINALKTNLSIAVNKLDASSKEVEKLKVEIEDVKQQNTFKTLASEREQWKTLIDALRAEIRTLQGSSEELQQKQHSELGIGSTEENLALPCGVKTEDMRENDDSIVPLGDPQVKILRKQVESLRNQLSNKQKEVDALRSKLDTELELKWERARKEFPGTLSWRDSLFSSLVRIFTPYDEYLSNAFVEEKISNGDEDLHEECSLQEDD